MDREYLDKQEKEDALIVHLDDERALHDVTFILKRARLRAFRSTHTLYKDEDKDVPEAICDRNGQVALGMCRNCGRGEIELDEPCDYKKLIADLHASVKQQEEVATKAMITLNNVIVAAKPFSEMCSKRLAELNEAFFHGGVK